MHNYLLIRETLDWAKASYADLRDDKIRALAQLWDATFSISFVQCRAAIKQNTLDFFAGIEGAEILEQKGAAGKSFGADDLLLIADDDDWYRPDVFSALRKAGVAQHQAALWPDGVFGYHIRWDSPTEAWLEDCLREVKLRPLTDAKAYSAVKTNNYLVTSRLFGLDLQGTAVRVVSHEQAAKELTQPDIDMLAGVEYLSLVNRHPCSYLVLNYGMQGKPTADGLKKLVRHYVEESAVLQLHAQLAWARPHIDAMRSLFSGVLQAGR